MCMAWGRSVWLFHCSLVDKCYFFEMRTHLSTSLKKWFSTYLTLKPPSVHKIFISHMTFHIVCDLLDKSFIHFISRCPCTV